MREIKFRGLRTDGKGWVYGVPYFIAGEPICFIIDNCQSGRLTQEDSIFQGKEVEYNSVGQFTGLTDKNGTDIYEGDLVRYKNGTSTPINIVYEGKNLTAYESNYSESYVVFYKGCFSLHNEPTTENHEKNSKYNGTSYSGEINRYHGFEYEIIGNIHER